MYAVRENAYCVPLTVSCCVLGIKRAAVFYFLVGRGMNSILSQGKLSSYAEVLRTSYGELLRTSYAEVLRTSYGEVLRTSSEFKQASE